LSLEGRTDFVDRVITAGCKLKPIGRNHARWQDAENE
jgi:hypothetical protein